MTTKEETLAQQGAELRLAIDTDPEPSQWLCSLAYEELTAKPSNVVIERARYFGEKQRHIRTALRVEAGIAENRRLSDECRRLREQLTEAEREVDRWRTQVEGLHADLTARNVTVVELKGEVERLRAALQEFVDAWDDEDAADGHLDGPRIAHVDGLRAALAPTSRKDSNAGGGEQTNTRPSAGSAPVQQESGPALTDDSSTGSTAPAPAAEPPSLDGVFGKWPGDESDAELAEAMAREQAEPPSDPYRVVLRREPSEPAGGVWPAGWELKHDDDGCPVWCGPEGVGVSAVVLFGSDHLNVEMRDEDYSFETDIPFAVVRDLVPPLPAPQSAAPSDDLALHVRSELCLVDDHGTGDVFYRVTRAAEEIAASRKSAAPPVYRCPRCATSMEVDASAKPSSAMLITARERIDQLECDARAMHDERNRLFERIAELESTAAPGADALRVVQRAHGLLTAKGVHPGIVGEPTSIERLYERIQEHVHGSRRIVIERDQVERVRAELQIAQDLARTDGTTTWHCIRRALAALAGAPAPASPRAKEGE